MGCDYHAGGAFAQLMNVLPWLNFSIHNKNLALNEFLIFSWRHWSSCVGFTINMHVEVHQQLCNWNCSKSKFFIHKSCVWTSFSLSHSHQKYHRVNIEQPVTGFDLFNILWLSSYRKGQWPLSQGIERVQHRIAGSKVLTKLAPHSACVCMCDHLRVEPGVCLAA